MKHRWASVFWLGFFSLGYLVTFVHGFPGIRYYPASHAWGLGGAYAGPSMGWYGRVAVGCVAGLVGWIIGAILDKTRGTESRPPWAVHVTAWILLLAAAAYATHHEWVKWM
ncbi:MAG TPA: hypothetical protein PLO37_12105 [Candidatus Hydrogenedentes bacterium]|nr:hypothetical protein [Candidatus Hydrogenedentota bacterium]HPG67585.1 hypothetical protein [Candidatus Hydrogenedentota bacterium]